MLFELPIEIYVTVCVLLALLSGSLLFDMPAIHRGGTFNISSEEATHTRTHKRVHKQTFGGGWSVGKLPPATAVMTSHIPRGQRIILKQCDKKMNLIIFASLKKT